MQVDKTLIFNPLLDRDRDNIVWHVPIGSRVYPVVRLNPQLVEIRGTRGVAGLILTKDYYCHDDNLFEVTPFFNSIVFGRDLYAYEFPTPFYVHDEYVVGFITEAKHILAYDIDYE